MDICLQRGANDLHAYGPADATATPTSLLQQNPGTGLSGLFRFRFISIIAQKLKILEKRPVDDCYCMLQCACVRDALSLVL